MGFLSGLFSLVKFFTLLVLLIGIGVPIYFESTNFAHLRIRVIHSVLTVKYWLAPDTTRPMLSTQYVAYESLLKNRPLVEMHPSMTLAEIVEKMRNSFTFGVLLPRSSQCHSKQKSFTVDGRQFQYYLVHHQTDQLELNDDRVLLYLHGGGYVVGDFANYVGFECHLSQVLNITVIHFEYERAPENPIPTIVSDIVLMYRHILDQGVSSSRLLIMGDSAGGGLTLLTIQSIIENKLPKPRAAVTLSPWTDLTLSGQSLERNRQVDVMLHTDQVFWIVENVIKPDAYVGGKSNPKIHSALFGSFKDFPPLYVDFGTSEVLEDDSTRIVEEARKAGVDVTSVPGKYMIHVYPLFFKYYPESNKALENIKQWIDSKFS